MRVFALNVHRPVNGWKSSNNMSIVRAYTRLWLQKLIGLVSRRRRLAVASSVFLSIVLSIILVVNLRHTNILFVGKRGLVSITLGYVREFALDTRPNISVFQVEELPQPGQLGNCSYNKHNESVPRWGTTNSHTPKSADTKDISSPCCSLWPSHVGIKKVNLKSISSPELKKTFWYLRSGGRWRPSHCSTNHRVAIIVPYRDREEHLLIFLNHMHQFLQRQLLDYGIFIIEQTDEGPFNRGLLMNIGFQEAMKQDDYRCCIFHDVDLLPQDDTNFYHCPAIPRHMSVLVDKFNYRAAYDDIFGGVTALSKEHFRLVNGFSNTYSGWGGEDDDLLKRAFSKNLRVARYPYKVTTYTMLKHMHANENSNRFDLLEKSDILQDFDGLSNLEYDVVLLELRRLYTRVLVKFDQVKLQRMYRFLKHVEEMKANKTRHITKRKLR